MTISQIAQRWALNLTPLFGARATRMKVTPRRTIDWIWDIAF